MNVAVGNGLARSRTSIKAVLFPALGVLSVLFVASIVWNGKTAFSAYSAAIGQKDFDQGANRFIKGLFEVLMERLATNNGLQGADPAPAAVVAEIEKRRSAVKNDFEPGLAALAQYEFSNKAVLMQELQTALDKANEFRKRADAALWQDRDQRDETLRKAFIPVMTDSVNAALKVWFSALYTTARNDPQLALLASIKEIGWQMRDWSGKERSNVASSIAAGAALTPDMILANAQFRARVDILWEQLQHLTYDSNTHPAIKDAMRTAQDQYFKGFRGRSDEIRKIGADGAKYPVTASQYVDESTPQIGTLLEVMQAAGVASEAHAVATIVRAFWELMIAAALLTAGLAIAIGSMLAVIVGVTRPLTTLSIVVQRLADNDTTVEIPVMRRNDELGSMATALAIFKANIIDASRRRGEQADQEQRQSQQRKADMIKLANDFEGAVGEIVETVSSASTELEASANTLSSTAQRAQELTTMVGAASEEAAANVQSVASATEEMTSSVNEISRQVQDSARMAGEAVDQALKTNDRVGELSKAAARIGDVVELINTIARQTNLLALNATIEAARAGEAGRGFAVVASEVKALAEQTAKATGEIGQQISSIQAATQESVNAIKEISSTIEKLSEISSTIAAAVKEQGAATQEISRNVQEAAQGTQQVSSHIIDVQRGASETGSASSQVLSAARSLSGDSNRLKLEVGKFLNSVRAAPDNSPAETGRTLSG
jgi:methyl-accepting chemotaxis protein